MNALNSSNVCNFIYRTRASGAEQPIETKGKHKNIKTARHQILGPGVDKGLFLIWDTYHLHRKPFKNLKLPDEKSNDTHHSVRNVQEKSGRSFEVIQFSHPFRFSQLASVPFDSIHLGLIVFLCGQNEIAVKLINKAERDISG